jgi:Skp family chaperone for outer membrane proteins
MRDIPGWVVGLVLAVLSGAVLVGRYLAGIQAQEKASAVLSAKYDAITSELVAIRSEIHGLRGALQLAVQRSEYLDRQLRDLRDEWKVDSKVSERPIR